MQMKTIHTIAAQGDLLIIAISDLPPGIIEVPPTDGRHIVAHSETGHHHMVAGEAGQLFRHPTDPMICYLRIDADFADFVHCRNFDTHESIRAPRGVYELHNQQEYSPAGWRRSAD